MPEYDFICESCETRFSVIRRMAEAADPYACPKCSGPTRRVFHMPPVAFHTDGFYATDYSKGDQTGSKNDNFRKEWRNHWGEEAPDPNVLAKDVPRNGGEKY